jgi:hypothetical protein
MWCILCVGSTDNPPALRQAQRAPGLARCNARHPLMFANDANAGFKDPVSHLRVAHKGMQPRTGTLLQRRFGGGLASCCQERKAAERARQTKYIQDSTP